MKKLDYKQRLEDAIQNEKIKCKCGHTVFLPAYEPIKICSHCNNYVFKDDRTKFRFMLSKKKLAVGRG